MKEKIQKLLKQEKGETLDEEKTQEIAEEIAAIFLEEESTASEEADGGADNAAESSGALPDETCGLSEISTVLLEQAFGILVIFGNGWWKGEIKILLEQPADLLKAALRVE